MCNKYHIDNKHTLQELIALKDNVINMHVVYRGRKPMKVLRYDILSRLTQWDIPYETCSANTIVIGNVRISVVNTTDKNHLSKVQGYRDELIL